MRLIHNPWESNPEYNCFGCCPNNPIGTRLRFYDDDEHNEYADVVSVWQPTQNHQSWINTLHGGIQAVLLDEVCGWVVFKKLKTSGVTAKMEIKYKHAVSTINGALILRGRLLSYNHRVAQVEGEIQDKDGKQLATCLCTYFTFNEDKAKGMGYIEPVLGEEENINILLRTE